MLKLLCAVTNEWPVKSGRLYALSFTMRLSPRRGIALCLWSLCLSWARCWFPFSQSERPNKYCRSVLGSRIAVLKADLTISWFLLSNRPQFYPTSLSTVFDRVSSVIICFLIMTSSCAHSPDYFPPACGPLFTPYHIKCHLVSLAARTTSLPLFHDQFLSALNLG